MASNFTFNTIFVICVDSIYYATCSTIITFVCPNSPILDFLFCLYFTQMSTYLQNKTHNRPVSTSTTTSIKRHWRIISTFIFCRDLLRSGFYLAYISLKWLPINKVRLAIDLSPVLLQHLLRYLGCSTNHSCHTHGYTLHGCGYG